MDKTQKAIERLCMGAEMSMSYYNAPLIITDSGGKDSAVLVDLALKAKIPIEIHHSHTTADAPATVRYVRQKFYRLECEGYRLIQARKEAGKPLRKWETAEALFRCWMEDKNLEGQYEIWEGGE